MAHDIATDILRMATEQHNNDVERAKKDMQTLLDTKQILFEVNRVRPKEDCHTSMCKDYQPVTYLRLSRLDNGDIYITNNSFEMNKNYTKIDDYKMLDFWVETSPYEIHLSPNSSPFENYMVVMKQPVFQKRKDKKLCYSRERTYRLFYFPNDKSVAEICRELYDFMRVTHIETKFTS
jgi:basic membrane lipoprotein Med (substrate-binding protein (PBP1-ABC) superfamily)